MQSKPTRWCSSPYDVALAERLADGLGVSPVVGTVLARRGFRDPGEAARFLAAGERHHPHELPGVGAACELITRHVERGSRIAVYGDYDVDGVCATAMLVRTLRTLGAEAIWELPSRFGEGYGLSPAAVERVAARGAGLLVTVDCGITAVAEVAAARTAGLDVVVTDHHRPGEALPDCPIVHPAVAQRPGAAAEPAAVAQPPSSPAAYPTPLCAAGVVLKLSEALRETGGLDPRSAEEDLDLAALATVCDLVPLRGENRRIVREGLLALARTQKPGLKALLEVAGVREADVSEHSLGFRLGPRINAAGRMGHADAALELLLTEDPARAGEVARELDLLNRDRREAETRILFAADSACAPQASAGALVVAAEGWHPGVVGIVASRLVERWRRPAVVIAIDAETQAGRGSGRSVPAYDLHAGLSACASHLNRFGGHRAAAGVELHAGEVEGFRAALAAHAAAELSPADLIPVERVDAVVPGGALGLALAEDLERLRPFGMGNPKPTLLVPAARLDNVAGMGEERQHARFTLVTGGSRARGVAFGATQKSLGPAAAEPHQVAVRLEANRWNGTVEPRLVLRALCPPAECPVHQLGEEAFWARVQRELEPTMGEAARSGPGDSGRLTDRRGEGFAGVAGDLLTSGESVLVAVADVARRERSLASALGGMSEEPPSVVSWSALAHRPELAAGHRHLVALDPPPGGRGDALLWLLPRTHLAWGPADAAFALEVWRAELELRPALTDAYRAVRALAGEAPAGSALPGGALPGGALPGEVPAGSALPGGAPPGALEAALRGGGAYPRTPECCARILRILTELGLVELDVDARDCRVVEGVRSDLELSPAFRAYRARFTAIERALATELPAEAGAGSVALPAV